MLEAIAEAEIAYKKDEVPIGCVIVCDDKIIARGHNVKISENNSLRHAEMVALEEAQKTLNTKYLSDCTMYLTLEPCPMCAGAMINTRLKKLVFGASDTRYGCAGSTYNLLQDNIFNHKVEVLSGVKEEECSRMLSNFFKEKRKKC